MLSFTVVAIVELVWTEPWEHDLKGAGLDEDPWLLSMFGMAGRRFEGDLKVIWGCSHGEQHLIQAVFGDG